MDKEEVSKQMVPFYKTSFDNAFNSMTILQEQAEKMFSMFLEQAQWLPEDGRKIIREWEEHYTRERAQFKSTVDENFKKVEEYFGFVVPIFMGK